MSENTNTETMEQTSTQPQVEAQTQDWQNDKKQKDVKEKEAKTKPNKVAFLENLSIDNFFEICLTTKSINDEQLSQFVANNMPYKTLSEIMDGFLNISYTIEEDVLVNVFHKKLWYELVVDDTYIIPAILKGRFNETNPVEDKNFKRKDAANILTLPIVVIDIVDDTLVILMRTPEIPQGFSEKLAPLMKAHNLKKIQVKLTTKALFNYYKQNLTYIVINNVL